MDETLRKAIEHLLQQIEQGDGIVEDLLLIEVDWGQHTPTVSDQPIEMEFQGRRWPLVFTDSELVLRRVLCRAGPRGKAILVFRNDSGFEIPLDIRARAHGGTCCRLGLRHRLYALTERGWPAEVDYAEWRSSIERHFGALVGAARQAGLKWDISRSDLEQILVQSAFGLRIEGREAAPLLAEMLSTQRKSPQAPTDLERSLLHGQLRLHQVAWSELLMWAAEEVDRAEELVRTGVMMGAEREARLMPNWGSLNPLRALLVSERQMSENDAVAAVVKLATDTLAHLHRSTRQSIVKDAEQALKGVLPSDSYNPWFPTALESAIRSIAQGLAARDPEAAAGVGPLRDHLFASQFQAQLRVLDQMAELVTQWTQQGELSEVLVAVTDWATWYMRQGSRLDLSALKLMHYEHQGTGLDEFIGRLVERYWHWRDQLNAAFSRRFLDHYEEALHDRQAGVFGTHRILDWVVKPALKRDQHVLLLVVDGMGFAAFWHLHDQWAEETPAVYAQQSQTALSLLPSVTSVSRKGLFLNALPTDRLDDELAYEAKARSRELDSLQTALHGYSVKLYTKSNLGGGQQLLNDLQFKGADVVAVVINAVDDDLKSATTTVRLPTLEDLGPLRTVVRTALAAGWTVVVTADHGHTWHRSKKLRRGPIIPGGGERFAPVASEEELPSDAIVTQDPHIVRVQEGKSVALLTAVGTYFGQNPRRGYHGGVGLEEIVIPCAFLTYEAPPTEPGDDVSEAEAGPESAATYDLAGVVLTLPDGRVISRELPFTLAPKEIRLLQALARLGEASEADLKQTLGTRRIAGPLAALRDRLAAEGLDWIEPKGTGPGGAVYRFRTELLD
jgi:hypothetical protein